LESLVELEPELSDPPFLSDEEPELEAVFSDEALSDEALSGEALSEEALSEEEEAAVRLSLR
jgi:hypothetical protein